MFKSKKGQAGILVFILLVIAFILAWAYALGKIFRDYGLSVIASQNLTGLEALFFANINLIIGIVLLVAILLMSNRR